MSSTDGLSIVDAAAETARTTQGLKLFPSLRSRARGDASSLSDWDFGYLADDGMDLSALLDRLVAVVGTDRMDLVDLQRAGGLLRYRAARDGHTVFEAAPGLADRFRLEAADFWCDGISVLRRGYHDVLVELPG